MPLRSDWSQRPCSIARGLDAFGDPWSMMVLREIFFGNNRFSTIRDQIRIADAVLSNRLLQLTESGLLERRDYEGAQRTRAEYVLTQAGADALPILNAMLLWTEKHLEPPSEDAHMYLIHRDCGARSSSAERCDACGAELTVRNSSWHSLTRSKEPIALDAAVSDQVPGGVA